MSTKKSKKSKKESALYYFYSQGCGFCKRIEPMIDELNKDGYDIWMKIINNINEYQM